jgi:uncharacterized protein (DUF433 family)
MSQDSLLDALMAFTRAAREPDARRTTQKILKELLMYGSATPDNLEMSKYLEFGGIKTQLRTGTMGAKIKGKTIPVSSILHHVEDLPLPRSVARTYPELTQAEWNAALRFATLVLTALERKGKSAKRSSGRERK